MSYLGHFILDVGPLPDLVVLLDFFTAQRDVVQLLAESAAVLPAFGVPAAEHFVLLRRRVHDGGELAEGTALQALDVGLLNLGELTMKRKNV